MKSITNPAKPRASPPKWLSNSVRRIYIETDDTLIYCAWQQRTTKPKRYRRVAWRGGGMWHEATVDWNRVNDAPLMEVPK